MQREVLHCFRLFNIDFSGYFYNTDKIIIDIDLGTKVLLFIQNIKFFRQYEFIVYDD